MVATPWDGQAARKDFLLHEGSEIKCAPVYRWAAADSLVNDLLEKIRPDRNLAGEWTTVSGDQ
jgi:hypothetical protein